MHDNNLLSELIRFYEKRLETATRGREKLTELIHGLNAANKKLNPKPRLASCINDLFLKGLASPAEPANALVKALAASYQQLYWTHHADTYMGSDFAKGFAFSQIVGKPGLRGSKPLFHSDQIAVGFSCQAAGLFYTPHAHKAVEFYDVLSGAARWQQGHNRPVLHQAGAAIFHDHFVPHAMQTLEPMLTTWAWVGDLDSEQTIVSDNWLAH